MASQANIIWRNFRHYAGKVRYQKKSNEMLGLVMKHGVNSKTITVAVRWKTYFRRSGTHVGRTSHYQVHDEEEFGRAGDVVVIKQCPRLGAKKNYYLRNVVEQAGRTDYWDNINKDKKDQLEVAIQKEWSGLKQDYVKTADERKTNMKRRHEDLKKLKMRAIRKAYEQINI